MVLFAGSVFGGSLQREKLQSELQHLIVGVDGRVGACGQDRNGAVCINGDQRFSLQSVMKLIVAVAVMDAVDHNGWRLDEPVVVHKKDLSLYVQPISKLVTEDGYRTTIGDLLRRAVVDSDSAATDILVEKLGGPKAVQAMLNRKSIRGVRFDRDEKHLQTEIAGIEWKPEFVDAALLEKTMANVPEVGKDASYRKYQTDPRDTATPRGMASFLFLLAQGKLLSVASTSHLLNVMTGTVTFPDRLKAGVPGSWTLAHKTGTSGSWKGVTAATNDVGVLTAPDGERISIVVFIGDSREDSKKRPALMADVARITTASYH